MGRGERKARVPRFVPMSLARATNLFQHAHLFLILHLQIFPHDMIGLSVFAQNKAVGADPVKAVLLVKTQSALIFFPNAEPDILLLLLPCRVYCVFEQKFSHSFLKGFSPRRCSRKYSAKTLSFAEDIGSVADGWAAVKCSAAERGKTVFCGGIVVRQDGARGEKSAQMQTENNFIACHCFMC